MVLRYCSLMVDLDGVAWRLAAERFAGFFHELQGAFVERDDLLRQIALALLSRQHVLMTGPPGTAKSQLAHAVLGRIVSDQTGRPSVFARQFTESTVQTDLVGPIDFKTLMETGRTEHFTDEGILGAVHGFLDEVFDGRDMLLRSTLNLLHERELKQGTKTTAGHIECALMTTNRYLAEILDNERLVAFVDRIAFLSFVPKSFATPDALDAVLRAHVAGRKPPALDRWLTIQDLDLLQATVDSVYIDDSICSALAALVRRFEAELAVARRASPAFVPSRYLSTRTVVRLGGLLRAICVYDRIFNDARRPLEVLPGDLAHLRLGMTLCGPSAEQAASLLANEVDLRERRQLAIVKSEREVFDRSLEALSVTFTAANPLEGRDDRTDRSVFDEAAPARLGGHDGAKLLALSRTLAVAASGGRRDADEARAALDRVLSEFVERALRSGLAAGASDQSDPAATVAALGVLADELESAGVAQRRAARWLRGRALEVIQRSVEVSAIRIGHVLSMTVVASGDLTSLGAIVDAMLHRCERLAQLKQELRHAGADEPDAHAADGAWKAASARVASELLPVVQGGLALAARRDLASNRGAAGDLKSALEVLEPLISFARQCADRLGALGADGAKFFGTLALPLVEPPARNAFAVAPGGPRDALTERCDRLLAALAGAGVLTVLSAADVLGWIAAALRLARDQTPAAVASDRVLGADGYRDLRREMGRDTAASLLVDFYLKLVPARGEHLGDPDQVVQRVAELVAALAPETRTALAKGDLARLETFVAYLERWWTRLAGDLPADPARGMDILVQAGFFQLTHDQGALTSLSLEARLTTMVFGDSTADRLLGRIAALEQTSATVAQAAIARRLERSVDPVSASLPTRARP